MKKMVFFGLVCLSFLPACRKAAAVLDPAKPAGPDTSAFVLYTIGKGKQYCDKNGYQSVSTMEMKFLVKFDSSAVYQTVLPENQMDINKLYGFSDNGSDHHQYSARFGWRWSGNALHLFAYVYNQGQVQSRELALGELGKEISCSIAVRPGSYLFTVNGVRDSLPRLALTPKAEGYQLYPYFGGDESAPHDIRIWIRRL